MRYQSSKGNWKKAVDSARDVIVAAGGDGTVAKVFRQVQGRDVPVGVIPMGTANNVARSLGLIGDARELVAGWDLANPHSFDVGEATNADGSKNWTFIESFGGGLFVTAIERGPAEVEQPEALVGGEIDRALTMLRRVVEEAEPARWLVKVDGRDYSGDYLAVEAMNIRLAGPGVPLAPEADPTDGLLDVALVTADDRGTLDEYLESRLGHREHAPPGIKVVRGSVVLLESPDGTIRVDDDLEKASGPLRITLKQGAVRFLG